MFKFFLLLFLLSSQLLASSVVKEVNFYNKHFLASFLLSVYGESIEKTVEEKVLSRGDVFLGACDPYSIIKKGKVFYRKNEGCLTGFQEIVNKPLGKRSSLRDLLLNEVCSEITSNKEALKHSLLSTGSVFNFKNFKAYGKLFNLEVNRDIFESLKVKASPWELSSKIFCRSEKWQKP